MLLLRKRERENEKAGAKERTRRRTKKEDDTDNKFNILNHEWKAGLYTWMNKCDEKSHSHSHSNSDDEDDTTINGSTTTQLCILLFPFWSLFYINKNLLWPI